MAMTMTSTKIEWKDRDLSPERTKVWREPKLSNTSIPVVYYLCRNGHLEHPHFMEVQVSSPDGVRLQDVINRLNHLRGIGLAAMYSWSSKRSYKNGYVWHDLTADDLIHPAHGQEYVLKGSELLLPATAADDSPPPFDPPKLNTDMPLKTPAPWKSMDLNEYKVYKNELTTADSSPAAADASTQTEERRQRRRALVVKDKGPPEAETTELEQDEISPPPSSSSPETLETLLGAAATAPVRRANEATTDRTANCPSGRMRASASAVLMHLISCGSVSVKDHPDLSLPSPHHYYRRPAVLRPPRGMSERSGDETPIIFPAVRPEDRDYFSGSLIETKNVAAAGEAPEFAGLKRSSSYNADRSSKLELAEKEIDGVQAKCIPRKPRAPARKEGNPPISRSTHGSKRINDGPVP